MLNRRFADICLRIRRGESIGVVGSSGAGKSTFADLLLGLLEPSAGRILVDGQSIGRGRHGLGSVASATSRSRFTFWTRVSSRTISLSV